MFTSPSLPSPPPSSIVSSCLSSLTASFQHTRVHLLEVREIEGCSVLSQCTRLQLGDWKMANHWNCRRLIKIMLWRVNVAQSLPKKWTDGYALELGQTYSKWRPPLVKVALVTSRRDLRLFSSLLLQSSGPLQSQMTGLPRSQLFDLTSSRKRLPTSSLQQRRVEINNTAQTSNEASRDPEPVKDFTTRSSRCFAPATKERSMPSSQLVRRIDVFKPKKGKVLKVIKGKRWTWKYKLAKLWEALKSFV